MEETAVDFSRLPVVTRELPLHSRVIALHNSAHVEWRKRGLTGVVIRVEGSERVVRWDITDGATTPFDSQVASVNWKTLLRVVPPEADDPNIDPNIAAAAKLLAETQASGGKLLVMTGAGMSVMSGVPVFRGSDGTMSEEFLRFLGNYNAARRRASLPEADDWFSFSVSDMFRRETEAEAWDYWRWRILRALVAPAEDYRLLQQVISFFGPKNVFVTTSNCDMLHERSGTPPEDVFEIHGSLGRVQCSARCCDTLWPVDELFLTRLRGEPAWVPRCPACGDACLRPNVMIFEDATLVPDHLDGQERARRAFEQNCRGDRNFAVLECGAGVVVSSIRCNAENAAELSTRGLVRINPSEAECAALALGCLSDLQRGTTYFPVVRRSAEALAGIVKVLGL